MLRCLNSLFNLFITDFIIIIIFFVLAFSFPTVHGISYGIFRLNLFGQSERQGGRIHSLDADADYDIPSLMSILPRLQAALYVDNTVHSTTTCTGSPCPDKRENLNAE